MEDEKKSNDVLEDAQTVVPLKLEPVLDDNVPGLQNPAENALPYEGSVPTLMDSLIEKIESRAEPSRMTVSGAWTPRSSSRVLNDLQSRYRTMHRNAFPDIFSSILEMRQWAWLDPNNQRFFDFWNANDLEHLLLDPDGEYSVNGIEGIQEAKTSLSSRPSNIDQGTVRPVSNSLRAKGRNYRNYGLSLNAQRAMLASEFVSKKDSQAKGPPTNQDGNDIPDSLSMRSLAKSMSPASGRYAYSFTNFGPRFSPIRSDKSFWHKRPVFNISGSAGDKSWLEGQDLVGDLRFRADMRDSIFSNAMNLFETQGNQSRKDENAVGGSQYASGHISLMTVVPTTEIVDPTHLSLSPDLLDRRLVRHASPYVRMRHSEQTRNPFNTIYYLKSRDNNGGKTSLESSLAVDMPIHLGQWSSSNALRSHQMPTESSQLTNGTSSEKGLSVPSEREITFTHLVELDDLRIGRQRPPAYIGSNAPESYYKNLQMLRAFSASRKNILRDDIAQQDNNPIYFLSREDSKPEIVDDSTQMMTVPQQVTDKSRREIGSKRISISGPMLLEARDLHGFSPNQSTIPLETHSASLLLRIFDAPYSLGRKDHGILWPRQSSILLSSEYGQSSRSGSLLGDRDIVYVSLPQESGRSERDLDYPSKIADPLHPPFGKTIQSTASLSVRHNLKALALTAKGATQLQQIRQANAQYGRNFAGRNQTAPDSSLQDSNSMEKIDNDNLSPIDAELGSASLAAAPSHWSMRGWLSDNAQNEMAGTSESLKNWEQPRDHNISKSIQKVVSTLRGFGIDEQAGMTDDLVESRSEIGQRNPHASAIGTGFTWNESIHSKVEPDNVHEIGILANIHVHSPDLAIRQMRYPSVANLKFKRLFTLTRMSDFGEPKEILTRPPSEMELISRKIISSLNDKGVARDYAGIALHNLRLDKPSSKLNWSNIELWDSSGFNVGESPIRLAASPFGNAFNSSVNVAAKSFGTEETALHRSKLLRLTVDENMKYAYEAESFSSGRASTAGLSFQTGFGNPRKTQIFVQRPVTLANIGLPANIDKNSGIQAQARENRLDLDEKVSFTPDSYPKQRKKNAPLGSLFPAFAAKPASQQLGDAPKSEQMPFGIRSPDVFRGFLLGRKTFSLPWMPLKSNSTGASPTLPAPSYSSQLDISFGVGQTLHSPKRYDNFINRQRDFVGQPLPNTISHNIAAALAATISPRVQSKNVSFPEQMHLIDNESHDRVKALPASMLPQGNPLWALVPSFGPFMDALGTRDALNLAYVDSQIRKDRRQPGNSSALEKPRPRRVPSMALNGNGPVGPEKGYSFEESSVANPQLSENLSVFRVRAQRRGVHLRLPFSLGVFPQSAARSVSIVSMPFYTRNGIIGKTFETGKSSQVVTSLSGFEPRRDNTSDISSAYYQQDLGEHPEFLISDGNKSDPLQLAMGSDALTPFAHEIEWKSSNTNANEFLEDEFSANERGFSVRRSTKKHLGLIDHSRSVTAFERSAAQNLVLGAKRDLHKLQLAARQSNVASFSEYATPTLMSIIANYPGAANEILRMVDGRADVATPFIDIEINHLSRVLQDTLKMVGATKETSTKQSGSSDGPRVASWGQLKKFADSSHGLEYASSVEERKDNGAIDIPLRGKNPKLPIMADSLFSSQLVRNLSIGQAVRSVNPSFGGLESQMLRPVLQKDDSKKSKALKMNGISFELLDPTVQVNRFPGVSGSSEYLKDIKKIAFAVTADSDSETQHSAVSPEGPGASMTTAVDMVDMQPFSWDYIQTRLSSGDAYEGQPGNLASFADVVLRSQMLTRSQLPLVAPAMAQVAAHAQLRAIEPPAGAQENSSLPGPASRAPSGGKDKLPKIDIEKIAREIAARISTRAKREQERRGTWL